MTGSSFSSVAVWIEFQLTLLISAKKLLQLSTTGHHQPSSHLSPSLFPMFDRPSLSASAARNIISWPLEKYSYAKPDPAAIQAPPADLQWTHLPHRDNLFIVFETYHIGTSDFNHRLREAVRVKVTYGYEILVCEVRLKLGGTPLIIMHNDFAARS